MSDTDDDNDMLLDRNDNKKSSVYNIYYNNLGKNDHGVLYMSIIRRQIISFFQWISNLVFFANGIIALVDICLTSAEPDHWLYTNAASAAAAGYPYESSSIGWVTYAVLISVSLAFSLTAGFMELRSYNIKSIGLDLKWSIYPSYSYNEKVIADSIERAQKSFSPHGTSYDNYFYLAPLYHMLLFALIFLHVFSGNDVISFTPLIVILAVILFVILCVYMTQVYFYPDREFQRFEKIKNYKNKKERKAEMMEKFVKNNKIE